jgi:hypothetical protein
VIVLRRLILGHRRVAVLLCAAALALRLLVPGGYMVAEQSGRITITLCPTTVPQPIRSMTMAMPGMHGDMPDHGKQPDHGKAEMPCAFSGLSAQALGAADPILLVAAIAFLMAVGLQRSRPLAIRRIPYLRPPLRGPPAVL